MGIKEAFQGNKTLGLFRPDSVLGKQRAYETLLPRVPVALGGTTMNAFITLAVMGLAVSLFLGFLLVLSKAGAPEAESLNESVNWW